MKLRLLPILLFPLAAAHADTFGSGANTFTMDFVDIGNTGNAADDTGFGAVDHTYRIGTYEVSRDMITKYNALGGGPTITMYDYAANGVTGGNLAARPATGVSWNEAARFVNWLNTSEGYSAAYKFTTGGANDDITLWTMGDSGYDAANPFRNSNAYYFLPSVDEWYKAAYYDPSANGGLGGYWDHATGSDSAPIPVASGTASGTAVYLQSSATGPAIITNAGGLSPYGTMAQGGNALEWTESGITSPNDSADEMRLVPGGFWLEHDSFLTAANYNPRSPTSEFFDIGFRVAAVPEPSGVLLTLISMMGVVLRRKR